jgi:hypothetical protein
MEAEDPCSPDSRVNRFFFSTRLPKLVIPTVWLGRYLEKPYSFSLPDNDNMWRFGTGPDAMRKILAAERR